MTEPKLYCGKPQGYWDRLLFQAEDLLRDKELGIHLVGVYPVIPGDWPGGGPKEPGIVCLYLDSVEPLINPYNTGFNKYYCYSHYSTDSEGFVNLINLFKWAETIIHSVEERHGHNSSFLFSDIIQEDESVADIIFFARELIKTNSKEAQIQLGQAIASLYRMLV